MSKVTHRKNHYKKLQNFKQKQKQMSKEQTEQIPQMPEIRNIPTWDKDANIELKGYEWEVIYNSIASLQVLQQVAQGVMSRNVLNGTVDMDFQKLDPQTLQYVNMTDEEKASYKAEFASMIENVKKQQAEAETKLAKQERNNPAVVVEEDKVPVVNNGEPATAEEKVSESTTTEAKVIQMS